MKKLLISASVVLLLLCSFALVVSAEDCAHKDNWELKFGEADILGYWEAINVCPDCGLVLKDEFCEPLITSRGYSFYVDSFSQSFYLNRKMIEKYEGYTGEKLNFGLVAGVTEQVGFNPVNSDGTLANENGILSSFAESEFNIIDIKITNLPSASYNTKVTACMYVIRGGDVIYIDGSKLGEKMTGVSYSGIVDAIENGETPTGIEYNSEFRKLTAEELGLVFGMYWKSDTGTKFAERQAEASLKPQNFASTRMFTRAELPSGSYVVVAKAWKFRAELWSTDENGTIVKTGTRPDSKEAGTYQIDTLWLGKSDGVNGDYGEFKYMAFNVNDANGGNALSMSPEGIAEVLQIYVPVNTKVATSTYEKTNDVSVEGLKLLEWDTTTLLKHKYHNNTSQGPTGTGTNNAFYTTSAFTKETLPVGSVIEINADWLYRAEYWVNSAKVSTRGGMVSTYRIVVTEEYWDGISERAFNISRTTNESLSSYTWDEVASVFKIYVPVN